MHGPNPLTGVNQTDSYTVSLTGPTSVGTISKGTSATDGTGDFAT